MLQETTARGKGVEAAESRSVFEIFRERTRNISLADSWHARRRNDEIERQSLPMKKHSVVWEISCGRGKSQISVALERISSQNGNFTLADRDRWLWPIQRYPIER
jgi:hypothetical protein